jgi:hypothetical protein
MACTDRFSFRAIDGLSRPDASNAKSCSSSAGVQGRPVGRGPSFISHPPSFPAAYDPVQRSCFDEMHQVLLLRANDLGFRVIGDHEQHRASKELLDLPSFGIKTQIVGAQ